MRNDQDVRAILDKLPPIAFIDNTREHRPCPSTPEPVLAVRRGALGFYPIYSRLSADELNRRRGVTRAQAEAMLVGSCFGWDVPGADPDAYDEQGHARGAH